MQHEQMIVSRPGTQGCSGRRFLHFLARQSAIDAVLILLLTVLAPVRAICAPTALPDRPIDIRSLPARSAFVHPDTTPAMDWHASWIGGSGASTPNLWTAYRRTVSLGERPRAAMARIAVDSKYWLWVNGRMVVREGGLKRGPTPTDTYFDEVDLAPVLQAGDNTIAILVWYFGKSGYSHQDSGCSALLFQLDGTSGPLLVSDATWRVQIHPAFGQTGEPSPNHRLSEANIRFDATLDPGDWPKPGYADSDWAQAKNLGRAPCAPWNRLVRRPIPLWWDSGMQDYTNGTELCAVSDGRPVIARLPYNAQVTPYFEIEAPAGLLIDIRTDHYRGGGPPNVRTEYVTKSGRQEFECPGWMNGHQVIYSFPAGVKIIRLAYRESGYATTFAGGFSCSDRFLNQLHEKAERTLYVTMRDTYMDCPDRERAQWWGDVVNELGEAFYALDRRSDQLARKGMLELAGWQRPDGILFSPVPGNYSKDLPLQMLAAAGREGFWKYAWFSGDLAVLRSVYPAVKRYLEIWDMGSDGLVMPRPGSWPWGDWGENVDMNLLANLWYHLALQGQLRMANTLDESADIPWIKDRLRAIESAFARVYWTGREYRSPEHTGATDDRANALAVIAGLVPTNRYREVTRVLTEQEHASPYMEKYVLEALCLMNHPDLAQERMKKRFRAMVEDPRYTTLWEGWGIGPEGYGGGSLNHAWSGGPLTIMSEYFAGITPTAPGFARYQILPRPGTLSDLQASVETHHGKIVMALEKLPSACRLEVESPQGTVAVVGIPIEAGESIAAVRVNGVLFWEGGRILSSLPGARMIGGEATTGHFRIELNPGRWLLDAAYQELIPPGR